MDGQDVIGHLMNVEREASSLLVDAQTEADRRKAVVAEESSKKFKEAHERLVTALESELETAKHGVDDVRKAELDAFQSRIEAIPRDQASFARYLDSVFAGR